MKLITAVLAGVLLLAGCSGTSSDQAQAPEAPATSEASQQPDQAADDTSKRYTPVRIVIKDGAVTPQGKRIEVKAGTAIRLRVISDVAEEIHVHSDPEHTFTVEPGEPSTEMFRLRTPGQVAVEAHGLGVTIVQLVVRA